ncbi:MAG TPA: DUF2007 domain-containing protein [Gemmataceae bacterium]|nr:DUF2007 domain-containing protein [Gemmataceae bacterium]
MTDKFVTVATFGLPYEAELAKSLLQNEGIESFLSGEQTADVWLGNAGLGDQLRLQVHEQDAQRAAGILAAQAAALDEDWEDKAEHDPDIWVCSLCGSPVSNRLSACLACQTPREGIRTTAPPSAKGIQPTPTSPPPTDPVQKREDVTAEVAPPPGPGSPTPSSGAGAEAEGPEDYPQLAPGDDLARRAFWASVFAIGVPCPLLPFAWYFLVRVLAYPGELSPGGMRYFYGAMLMAGVVLFIWLAFCAGIAFYR